MQTAPATAAPSGSELIGHTAPTVGALELLDESERLWAADLDNALRCDGSPDSRHRRRLVLDALAAYVQLIESAAAGPSAVFRRWPACTTVALAAIAATAGTQAVFVSELADRTGSTDSDPWLAGWAECWSQLTTDRPGSDDGAPGVPLLRALSAGGPEVVTPQLRLHPETGAVTVVFPGAPGRGAKVEAGGGECPSVDGRWVLPRPVRRATCHDVLGDVHLLPVVDMRDPLLVFDDDGRLLPADTPLPAGEVWIVHLGEPGDDAFEGERRVVEVAAPPVGWTRWWLGRVELSATTAVRSAVHTSGPPRHGPWRPVANAERADLEFDAPLPGLFDVDGDVVYAAAPRLRLPGRADETWSIEVRRDDSSVPHRWSATGGGLVTLADGLRGPVAGRFTVHAHAPGHRAVRGSFTLVEGLEMRAKPEIRPFADGGLMPAAVNLTSPPGLQAPRVVRLGRRDSECDVRLAIAGSDRRLGLRLRLPHCAVRTRIGTANEPWAVGPREFTLDDLAADAALDVRFPERIVGALGRVPALVAAAEPDDLSGRRIQARRVSADVYRYPLAGLADQVRLHGSTPLWLETMRARVGTVSHALARGAEVTGSHLRLIERARHGKVRVTVCAPLAPWIRPQVAELAEDESGLVLDSQLVNRALLTVVTPVEADQPVWPDPAQLRPPAVALRVASQATPGGSAVERAMTRYLAGTAPLPAVPAALPLMWPVAARGALALGDGLGRLTAQECTAYLATRPATALLATGDTGLSASELVEPLIRAGLAAHGVRTIPAPATVRGLWTRTPLVALLLSSPLLPYLTTSPHWDPAELDDVERDVLAAVQAHSPAGALALLTDPASSPPASTDDVGNGAPASFEVTDALTDVSAYAGASPAAALFAGVDQSMTSSQAIGALSLGCALVARLAAQRDPAAAALEQRLRPVWIEIARHDPTRAMHDLMVAEFAVSGWYARHG